MLLLADFNNEKFCDPFTDELTKEKIYRQIICR